MRYLVFASLLLAACVGQPPSDPGGGGDDELPTVDGGTPGTDGGNDIACVDPATPPGDGHHNAGASCLSCHTGAGAPLWTAAGTLFTDANGSAPISGATVTLVDADGKEITIVTATNGNFWTNDSLTLPLHPKASRCPATKAMNATAGGNCNSCHTAGGAPGRIHL